MTDEWMSQRDWDSAGERYAMEAEREYADRFAPMATASDAHREWHLNSGVPMGQPGCPQDACHLPEEPYEEPTVKCGNKAAHGGEPGYHYSAADVRRCYASTGRFSGRPATPQPPAPRPAPPAAPAMDWTVPPVPRPEPADPLAAVHAAREAKAVEEAEAKRARYAAWRSIPVFTGGRGYYALEMGGTVHYFKVSRPDKGQHKGKTFVEEQAGDAFHKMGWVRTGEVLDAIARDPEAAGLLYGQTIGRCYRCHRTLTDAESRAAGIGPDCAKKG